MRFWSRRFYRRAIQLVGSHFYFNPDPDLRKSILVAGAARSGTTWLGDLIASQIPNRILFEPSNPELVSDYRRFHYFQYMRPGAEDPNSMPLPGRFSPARFATGGLAATMKESYQSFAS